MSHQQSGIATTSSGRGMRTSSSTIAVRPMLEQDLAAADHVLRIAFGTFLGLADPASFKGDGGYVRPRWRADPSAAFVAEIDGSIVGSVFVTSWGSVGFPGPLSVRPDLWDRGVGSHLMVAVMDRFARWRTEHIVGWTYANSSRHVGWYQTYGFWPRFLTAIMAKPVQPPSTAIDVSRFSEVAERDRAVVVAECREVTDTLFPGWDAAREINAVASQQLGDTVLLWGSHRLLGFAVCQSGPGSEAGSGTCYIKVAAVRSGPSAGRDFERLILKCEAMASALGASRLVAGVNTARREAYQHLLTNGFRIDLLGVALQVGQHQGTDREGIFALDDWR